MLDKVNSFQSARKDEAKINAAGMDFSKPMDE